MVTRFKKAKDQVFFPSLFLLGLLLLVINSFLVSSNLKINQKRKELKAQIEDLKKEIQILEEKNQQLKAGISETQKEGYLEKVAREEFGLKKPGEQVVVVLPPKEKKEEQKGEKSFWQKFLDRIGNFFGSF